MTLASPTRLGENHELIETFVSKGGINNGDSRRERA